jgi:hypothetical protein
MVGVANILEKVDYQRDPSSCRQDLAFMAKSSSCRSRMGHIFYCLDQPTRKDTTEIQF